MPVSPAATAHGGQPDQVTVSHRTATTTEMTSSARPCVHPTTATAGMPSRGQPGEEVGGAPQPGRRPGPARSAPPKRSDAAAATRRGPAPRRAATAYIDVVSSRTVTGRESPEFARALEDLHRARLRPEIRLTEVPAPQRIAPYAVALTADVVDPRDTDDDLASGRLRPPARPERPRAVGRRVAGRDLRPRRARARAGHRPAARRGRLELAHRRPRRPRRRLRRRGAAP